MPPTQKPIRLSGHARGRLQVEEPASKKSSRRFKQNPGSRLSADGLSVVKNFPFNAEWNRNHYVTKQVRPVFADDPSEIVVVTIYVYYF